MIKPIPDLYPAATDEMIPSPENIRELLLETVKNSEHISKELQNIVAKYVEAMGAPRYRLHSTEELERIMNGIGEIN